MGSMRVGRKAASKTRSVRSIRISDVFALTTTLLLMFVSEERYGTLYISEGERTVNGVVIAHCNVLRQLQRHTTIGGL